MAKAYVGTSGWHYKHWRGRFYPEDLPVSDWLGHYCAQLRTVEVNNSFYKLLNIDVVQEWHAQTPPEFVFAVKGSRYLTHNKKLKDPETGLARFFEPVSAFREKLGPILFQLPPSWHVNPDRLRLFLQALPRKQRVAFELRDASWHTEEALAVLRDANAAFCIYELAGFKSPLAVTADFVYVRLHGPGEQRYEGNYTPQALRAWTKRIRDWQRSGKDVYVYFDNDQSAYAVHNALKLQQFLQD